MPPAANPKFLSRPFFGQGIGFTDEVLTDAVREHSFIFLFFARGNRFVAHKERVECLRFRSFIAKRGAIFSDFPLHAGNQLGEEVDGLGAIV